MAQAYNLQRDQAIPEQAWSSGEADLKAGGVCLKATAVGEPDAGNPHVRFDERDVETEHGEAIEAPPDERGGNR